MKQLATLTLGLLLLIGNAISQLQAVPGDQRPADRDAIMKHLDKIFQGFIHQDAQALREGHSKDWRGFLTGSRSIGKGIDTYMQGVAGALTSQTHMASYKILESDITFYGDVALLPYIVDIEGSNGYKQKLRIFDVFAKLNGEWVQVGTNTGLHPDQIELQAAQPGFLSEPLKKGLLDAREAVWRGWFANDKKTLETGLSDDIIAIDGGSNPFSKRSQILSASEQFATGGGKLTRLEFPQTEIQLYGNTATVYSSYEFDIERGGRKDTSRGRATETFVFRDHKWINTGWHLDEQNPPKPAAGQ